MASLCGLEGLGFMAGSPTFVYSSGTVRLGRSSKAARLGFKQPVPILRIVGCLEICL